MRFNLPKSLAWVLFSICLLSCKHEGLNSNLNSDDSLRQPTRSHVYDAVLDAVSHNEDKTSWLASLKNIVNKPLPSNVWFASTIALDDDWMVQSPEGYWGRDASTLPINLACKAGDAGCDPQFLRHLCSSDTDCQPFHTACQPLEASVYADGQSPKKMCLGSGDKLLDRFYRVITSGKQTVDITSLSEPQNRFYEMMVNALTRLALKPQSPTVRILFSGKETHKFNITVLPAGILNDLLQSMKTRASKDLAGSLDSDTAGVEARLSKIDQFQIEMRYVSKFGVPSWNHAKIVIVDQDTAMEGGHNYYDPDYLSDQPIFDISMVFHGAAVSQVQAFVNALWQQANYTSKNSFFVKSSIPYRDTVYPAGKPKGNIAVLGVGRMGAFGDNPADRAFPALLQSAQKSIYIAQEDIFSKLPVNVPGFIRDWIPLPVQPITPPVALPSLVDAILLRNVDVRIIQSGQESFEGYGMMGLAETHARIVRALLDRATKLNQQQPGLIPTTGNETLRYHVCKMFHHTNWHINAKDEVWAGGEDLRNQLKAKIAAGQGSSTEAKALKGKIELMKFGAHPKLIIIDSKAFYIGSNNFYPANLQEFGLVIDDEKTTATLQREYFDKAWNSSANREADCGSPTEPLVKFKDLDGIEHTVATVDGNA
ncbi:MAG: hypothetical protein H7249_05015 [Chitinophagaceae bacterium]|nr:hypothetical protein [Oligoflexus sp.]